VYPFVAYHASSKSTRRYTLYVASEGVRKRWQSAFVDAIGVYKARQEANKVAPFLTVPINLIIVLLTQWFYQQSLTDHFFRLVASNVVEGPALRQSGEITSAAPFSEKCNHRLFPTHVCDQPSTAEDFLQLAAQLVYMFLHAVWKVCHVSFRAKIVKLKVSSDYHRVSTLANPTALTAIQTLGSKSYNKLIVHFNNSLFALSLDAIADLAVGRTEPQPEPAMERVVPQESPVYFFRCVQSGERVLSQS